MADQAEDAGATLEDQEWYERAKTIEKHSPSQTVVPRAGTPDSYGMRALGALESVAAERGPGVAAAIELGETIGEGGMGIVRLGTQVALGRPVAVKTLKHDIRGEAATLKILREAWITGSLEHPNVVPVYDVGVDDDGRPLIVLKKIEGTEWSELMADGNAVRDSFGVHDLLEWNLSILLSVCNAIRFAHSRSVLHRDLKPENVMIGSFGEVYVVDWGIAVSLEDDATGRLPLAKNATEMAGTPYYMAPEMLGGKEVRLSERTDIYLLGAILYEIVAGTPPHQGMNLMAVVASVAASSPKVPDGVSEELAAIIERAIARAPEERFESVEDFRLAIIAFLEHRGSLALTRDADARREHLLGYIAAADVGDEEARGRIYNLFSECRFGYLGALDAWRENDGAREGLRGATEAMIGYELAEDDPRAAAALAAQLDHVTKEIEELIAEATKDKAARQHSLVEAGRQEDRSVGRRTRAVSALVLGAIWCAVPITMWACGLDANWVANFVGPAVLVGILLAWGYYARESLRGTAFNRRVSGLVLVAFGMEIPLHLGQWLMGMDPAQSQVQALVLWAAALAFGVVAIDKRIWPACLATTVGYFVASTNIELRWPVMSVDSLIMLANVSWIWRINREDVDRFVDGPLSKGVARLTGRRPPPG